MLFFGPSLRLSCALALIAVSVLMIADILGLFPDNLAYVQEARKSTVLTVGESINDHIERGRFADLNEILPRAIHDHEQLIGISVHRGDGSLLAQSGDIPAWVHQKTESPNHAVVNLYRGERFWGQLSFAFKPFASNSLQSLLRSPLVRVALFLGTLTFLIYELYLRRALNHLDPTAVMPERVRTMIDALVEGVVLIDRSGRIVMANISFARNLDARIEDLPGKSLSELGWQGQSHAALAYPWQSALESGIAQENKLLSLTLPRRGKRHYAINVTPILDEKKHIKGALATFDDQTDVMLTNEELKNALTKLEAQQQEIEHQNEELRKLATRDPLTGCLNRRAFFEVFENEFQAAENRGQPLSCIMCDLDFFKQINDNYGHSTGDRVIQHLSRIIDETIRENDYVCRYGGEEFCVLLPGLLGDAAATVAERIRLNVESEAAGLRLTGDRKITASFGVSSLGYGAENLANLIDQADRALYMAKDGGRNQVVRYRSDVDFPQQVSA